MKTLFLQGFGISIKVVDGKVRITNGKLFYRIYHGGGMVLLSD